MPSQNVTSEQTYIRLKTPIKEWLKTLSNPPLEPPGNVSRELNRLAEAAYAKAMSKKKRGRK